MTPETTIEIIPFDPKYAKDFAQLNIEWLEKYFVVEPHDAELLHRCEETIVNPGGHIFSQRMGRRSWAQLPLFQWRKKYMS